MSGRTGYLFGLSEPIPTMLLPSRLSSIGRICLASALTCGVWLGSIHTADAETVHVVGPSHTLAKISRRYHVSVEAIREANDLAPGEKLKVGQRLTIPERNAPSSRASTKTTGSGRDEERDSLEENRRSTSRNRRDKSTSDSTRPHQRGLVTVARGHERWSGKVQTPHGRILPAAISGVERILRDINSNQRHPIEPRLINMLALVSDHFGGKTIEVVSGFRPHTESQYTPHSNHNLGRAVDFVVRGVTNEAVRDFCHTLENVGVGYYPNSSFVHLDVRTGTAHWVDESGPGDPPQYRSITSLTSNRETEHLNKMAQKEQARRVAQDTTKPTE